MSFLTLGTLKIVALPSLRFLWKLYTGEGAATEIASAVHSSLTSAVDFGLEEAGGFLMNVHASKAYDSQKEQAAGRTLTANHDIATFSGFVLGKIIEQQAKLPRNKDLKKDLLKLAEVLPDQWRQAAMDGQKSLPADQVQGFLKDVHATLQGTPPTIDSNELAATLRSFCRSEDLRNLLPADTLNALAGELEQSLPHALADALVKDHPLSATAFKKAALQFQAECQKFQEQQAKGQKQLLRRQKDHIKLSAATNRTAKAMRKEVKALRKAVENMPDSVLKSDPLKCYLANLRKRFAVHNSIGIGAVEDPKQKQGPDKVEDLFVQPTCTGQRLSPEAMEADLKAGKKAAQPILPVLERQRHVVLLADPGMGKSTLIQWLVVALADTTTAVSRQFGKAVPLPFILRDLVPLLPADAQKWTWQALVQAFLTHRYDQAGEPIAAPLAHDDETRLAVLDSPQAWFMLDGLDEIGDPAKRRALRRIIWQGMASHFAGRFLITSRVVGYDEAAVHELNYRKVRDDDSLLEDAFELLGQLEPGWLRRVGSEQYTISSQVEGDFVGLESDLAHLSYLAPWDDTQQEAFSKHWFSLRLGDTEGPVRAREFMAAVHSHASTGTIGRVPNLLLLMALLYRYRAHLPNGRANVYAKISEAYLGGIDLVRRVHQGEGGSIPWKQEEKERLLALVAMHMQLRRSTEGRKKDKKPEATGEILVSRADLKKWLCPEFGKKNDQEALAEMDKFITHIAQRSGLLLERGEGLYGFTHLSFQEYYTACWLELEFRRLLNAQARGGPRPTGGLFAKSATAVLDIVSEIQVEKHHFSQWADQPVWREPLLFVVEKLSANADDTTTVMDWMFGGDLSKKYTAQGLLATLSLDPEVALDQEQRHRLWEHLWRTHLRTPDSVRVLLSELPAALLDQSEHQDAVFGLMAKVAMEVKPDALSLRNCTALTSLEPLTEIASVLHLSLNGCQGLTSLKPLKGWRQLTLLYMSGCTGLKSIDTLVQLKELKILAVNDSGLTGQQIKELRTALPRCAIRAKFGPESASDL